MKYHKPQNRPWSGPVVGKYSSSGRMLKRSSHCTILDLITYKLSCVHFLGLPQSLYAVTVSPVLDDVHLNLKIKVLKLLEVGSSFQRQKKDEWISNVRVIDGLHIHIWRQSMTRILLSISESRKNWTGEFLASFKFTQLSSRAREKPTDWQLKNYR